MKEEVNKFYSHNVASRLNIVKTLAEYICRIKYYGFVIELYLLDRTYIEVYYNVHNKQVSTQCCLPAIAHRAH